MALKLSSTLASALADVVSAAVDSGSGAGYINVYAGTFNDLNPTGDTLLAEFALADPAAAAAVAGVSTYDFDPDLSDTVLATGTPSYFIVFNSSGTAQFGGSVGTSGADMNFSSTTWVAGGTVSLTTGAVTQPQAA